MPNGHKTQFSPEVMKRFHEKVKLAAKRAHSGFVGELEKMLACSEVKLPGGETGWECDFTVPVEKFLEKLEELEKLETVIAGRRIRPVSG